MTPETPAGQSGVSAGSGSCQGRAGRAAPMTPEDRRAAILRGTVPLLRERGVNVTTRELAAAAGVAEGTLFRVFPDKAALVRAAVEQALDPAPILTDLAAIDPTLDLRPALTSAVRAVLRRTRHVAALLAVVHQMDDGHVAVEADGSAGGARRMPGLMHGPHGRPSGRPEVHPLELVGTAIAALLEPYRGRLRRDPAVCARMIVAVVLAASQPLSATPDPALTADEIVELFLDGVLTTPETRC